jgi:hypothetical protein
VRGHGSIPARLFREVESARPKSEEGSERAVRDEWRFNYLGFFLSVSGIILVIACVALAYSYLDYTETKLDGKAVAERTLPPPTVTIPPSTTTTLAPLPTTTLAPDFQARNRQDFLAVVNTLMATTKVKLTVFNNAIEAGDDDTITRLAGEMALLWNGAPPRAPAGTPFIVEYREARSNVGDIFLSLYDAMNRHDRTDIADAKTRITVEAIPLIDTLREAIGP